MSGCQHSEPKQSDALLNDHHETDIFSAGGGKQLADRFDTHFLGSIPLDPDVVRSGDSEKPYLQAFPRTTTAACFDRIVEQLKSQIEGMRQAADAEPDTSCGVSACGL